RASRGARLPALPRGFFFSSRRRHTRFSRDWSSDVCSSDLVAVDALEQLGEGPQVAHRLPEAEPVIGEDAGEPGVVLGEAVQLLRSEERRVGKEWRSRGAAVEPPANGADARTRETPGNRTAP